jgi:ankyrin repeat protein
MMTTTRTVSIIKQQHMMDQSKNFRHRRHHSRRLAPRPFILVMAACYLVCMSTTLTVSFRVPVPCQKHQLSSFKTIHSVRPMTESSTMKVTSLIDGIEMNDVAAIEDDDETNAINNFINATATTSPTTTIDRRPYAQRRKGGTRKARRMNHAFRYLYRDDNTKYINVTAMEYLSNFYDSRTAIIQMNESFPPLLDLNVSRHIHPKMRFLKETILKMGGANGTGTSRYRDDDDDDFDNELRNIRLDQLDIPPQYFGARLERVLAPRHAFLVHAGLPHGRDLLFSSSSSPTQPSVSSSVRPGPGQDRQVDTRWREFLLSCRNTKQFCALCNRWVADKQDSNHQKSQRGPITTRQIEDFEAIFSRGLLAASRGDISIMDATTVTADVVNITAAEVVRLLIQHGANIFERDQRGSSLLHWAAGTGNLDVVATLLPYFDAAMNDKTADTSVSALMVKTERDSSTLLHWAAAGVNSKEFGTGGHVHISEYLLTECSEKGTVSPKTFVNTLTEDGNSPLMWAAWSGSLDTVKLLVRHRADTTIANRNGCTVAHWAASGGSLPVCKYLAEIVGVDFSIPNHGGNTPLTHATAFGRVDIVEWIRNEMGCDDDDSVAAQLASDFVRWNSDGDVSMARRRRQILQLFEDDFWSDNGDSSSSSRGRHNEDDGETGPVSLEEAQQIELDQF